MDLNKNRLSRRENFLNPSFSSPCFFGSTLKPATKLGLEHIIGTSAIAQTTETKSEDTTVNAMPE